MKPLLLIALILSLGCVSAQQQPIRASFPARPGQVWQVDVVTPSGPLRWRLSYTGFDKDNLVTGTAEIQDFRGAAEWNNVGQRSRGFVFTEAPGRFAGSTGVWVCVFPRHVDELFSNHLVGTAAYQVGNGLTGNTQCQATLLSDTNPIAAIPTAPTFDAKAVLPPRAGQRWQIKLSNAESLRVQLIGYATTDLLEGRVEGRSEGTDSVIGGYEHPSSTVPNSLGAFYFRQGNKIVASCRISTDSKLEVTGKTHTITGSLATGSPCLLSIEQP